MRRLLAAAFVALLVLAVAVTPLTAAFRPGYFDLWLPSTNGYAYPINVTLKDDTGLVAAFDAIPLEQSSTSGETRRFVVNWVGDTDSSGIWMHFYAADDGYQLDQISTSGPHRPIGTGLVVTFVLVLRAPVDAASVEVVHV